MRLIIAPVAAALMLAGCAEYEARQQAEAQAAYIAQEAQDDAQCRSYGAQPGSPSYVQCRMNISNQRANVSANDRAIVLDRMLRR